MLLCLLESDDLLQIEQNDQSSSDISDAADKLAALTRIGCLLCIDGRVLETQYLCHCINEHANMHILDRYRNDTRAVGIRRLCETKALLQINDRKNSTAQVDDTLDEVRRIGDTGDIGEIADLTPYSSSRRLNATYWLFCGAPL